VSKVAADDIAIIRSSGLFDEAWYLDQYPDVRKLRMAPIEHYLWLGRLLKRSPSKRFDAAAYLDFNNDVAQSGVNPLLHFVRFGRKEGREFAEVSRAFRSRDLNSNTYTHERPYPFVSAEELQAIAGEYLRARSAAGTQKAPIAVYTAITGQYDSVPFHKHLMPKADYYLYSDDKADNQFIYSHQPVPYFDEDPTRVARFVKTHPHILFPGHRIAIWIDGNILINKDLSDLIERFDQSGLPVAAVPHPLRSSVYSEAKECVKLSKDDSLTIDAQMGRYKSEGFDCTDLVESNFMMFRLDHPKLSAFLNAWWLEMERGSRRDQLSFNYAMRKADASWFQLTEKPDSVRNHPSLALFHHGTGRYPHSLPAPSKARERSYHDVLNERVGRQTQRTADVIVCVHNALDVVKLCLESVAASREPAQHRIVIVNDGSDEPTSAWLGEFASSHTNTHLIRHQQARGYTKAANAGLRAMDADLAILLNSDTIVGGHWIQKMLDAAFSNPGVGIVGPLSSAASHQSIPDHRSTANQTAVNEMPDGYTVSDMNDWCERNTPADFVPRVPLVHGFCFGVSRDVVRAVGYFDETNFPFGYGEENDYCLRATNAGFGLVIATHTYVYHKKSQSYQDERRTVLMKNGNMKIRELHGEDRVIRSVRSVQKNPHLVRMRELSIELFVKTRAVPASLNDVRRNEILSRAST
jgi:GT2 family glycosyltransferase